MSKRETAVRPGETGQHPKKHSTDRRPTSIRHPKLNVYDGEQSDSGAGAGTGRTGGESGTPPQD